MPSSKGSTIPPGNTGTHIPPPNTYLLSQLTRANYITARRTPFTESPDEFSKELQRHVHFEGNRPPNRRILFYLRLLTYYPPVHDVLPELIELLESDNVHICRLAHYHIRQMAPIRDAELYRMLLETLERQAISSSPARRACATKTFAKVFHPSDVGHASDFVLDVFNKIGGARVRKPVPPPKPTRLAGVTVGEKEKKETLRDRAKAAFAQNRIVRGEVYEPEPSASTDAASQPRQQRKRSRSAAVIDDGAGGTVQTSAGSADYISSRSGKMLVGHATLAAMRRINRVAIDTASVESYIFDSGLMSVVASTVRHTVALLELRSTVSPKAVSNYLLPRLPQKNPPANMRLFLEDLGARVYFARLLSVLAEDPNLSAYIPDEGPKQAKRDEDSKKPTLQSALGAPTMRKKATQLFKFLFNRENFDNVAMKARLTANNALALSKAKQLPRDDSIGVEFAEALINLVKNASNRVLIEALRGLSKRKWTTWFEAPIPQSALYNAPELQDGGAFGGTDDLWDDDDDDDKEDEDSEDENELGAYEDDLAGNDEEHGKSATASSKTESKDPELEQEAASEKENWFTRLKSRRKERRVELMDTKAPFYLRKIGEGMVPALEIILRRINAGLLNDEPVHRFAAVDAVIVLSRAKIYGHSESEHDKLRQAQSTMEKLRIGTSSSSRALVVVGQNGNKAVSNFTPSAFHEERHPFQALVRPLFELIEEDPNPFIRGRAAIALMFVIAAGAGRNVSETNNLDVSDEAFERTAKLREMPLLLRYFRNFVRHNSAGSGVGLKQMSELVDYIIYEILDAAPELAPSAVAMTEEWARVHPTVGVCGRLGAIWEKVLSIGQGDVVGASIMRAMASDPRHERVAAAATIFLRRRTLDVAILTVGAAQVGGLALPEPLPRAVGVEMERYFSVLWHTALLGPSAECRWFAVESLGGAAVLAGEPFRICTYERLVELVRIGGFGVRPVAERVLTALDALYAARETFSETRAQKRIPRNGSCRTREWIALVWRLRCQAVAAAQIALGVPPPPGWQALGPGAAADVTNAERVHLPDSVDDASSAFGIAADASVTTGSAVGASAGADGNGSPLLLTAAPIGPVRVGSSAPSSSRRSYDNDRVAPTRGRERPYVNDDEYPRRSHDRDSYERDGYRRDSRRDSYGNDYNDYHDDYDDDDDGYDKYDDYRRHGGAEKRRNRRHDDMPEDYKLGASSSHMGKETGRGQERERKRQEEEDRVLAEELQKMADEEAGVAGSDASSRLGGVELRDRLTSTAGKAEQLLKQGIRSGKGLTDKVLRSAARSAAMDKLRGSHR